MPLVGICRLRKIIISKLVGVFSIYLFCIGNLHTYNALEIKYILIIIKVVNEYGAPEKKPQDVFKYQTLSLLPKLTLT